jgi:rare lipoprotein A
MKKQMLCSLFLIVVFSSSCAHKTQPNSTPDLLTTSSASNPCTDFQKTLIGRASFYGSGKGFIGKKTACGNIFTGKSFTAAVKRGTLTPTGTGSSFKCGTAAKITDQNTGKVVWVTLDDTGRLNSSRVIDLSFAAAKQLDIVNEGTAPVKVQICVDN